MLRAVRTPEVILAASTLGLANSETRAARAIAHEVMDIILSGELGAGVSVFIAAPGHLASRSVGNLVTAARATTLKGVEESQPVADFVDGGLAVVQEITSDGATVSGESIAALAATYGVGVVTQAGGL